MWNMLRIWAVISIHSRIQFSSDYFKKQEAGSGKEASSGEKNVIPFTAH
jgi:hypothetical protein